MIAFASLLLGLIVGPEPVELLVGDSVALVEIQLDGVAVGELQGEPWSLVCDFGEELAPHELLAVAYDHDRREVDRARQWVNLPRRPAEASIMIDGGQDGQGVAARLTWQSVFSAPPQKVVVTFDGQPVKVRDPKNIVLPDHDPKKLHLLRAELDFSRNVTMTLEKILGGTYTDQLDVELTAVPVALEKGAELPRLEDLRGRLTRNGHPLTVVAAERGPVEIVIVRDEAIRRLLSRIGRSSEKALRRRARIGLRSSAVAPKSLRFHTSLPRDHLIRFLWPSYLRQGMRGVGASKGGLAGDPRRAHVSFDLLSPSQAFSSRDGGLYWLLTEYSPPAGAVQEQRLADAVAVAGLLAAGRNRRRAVVLVTRAGTEDASQFSSAAVRGYLRQLKVPLFVWSPAKTDEELVQLWGPVVEISSLNKLEQAVNELKRRLERQRIIWVSGVHPPGEIAWAGAGAGLQLVL